jgi:hypothetical protein
MQFLAGNVCVGGGECGCMWGCGEEGGLWRDGVFGECGRRQVAKG